MNKNVMVGWLSETIGRTARSVETVSGGLTIVVEFADGGDSVSLIGPFEKSWVDGPFFSQEIIAVRLDGRTLTLETRDAAMVAFWRGLG